MSSTALEEPSTSTGKARIIVSAREGIIEIEGSELFVSDQLSRLKTVICQVVASSAKYRAASDSSIRSSETGASATSAAPPARYASGAGAPQALEGFGNLYTHADGRVRVLKDLPGTNMANKTVNAALLVAHANALLGAEQTTFDTIRSVCKEQACHDSNNFSATLKREKDLFIHSGSLHITLSPAGRERAAFLAAQLNNAA